MDCSLLCATTLGMFQKDVFGTYQWCYYACDIAIGLGVGSVLFLIDDGSRHSMSMLWDFLKARILT